MAMLQYCVYMSADDKKRAYDESVANEPGKRLQ